MYLRNIIYFSSDYPDIDPSSPPPGADEPPADADDFCTIKDD